MKNRYHLWIAGTLIAASASIAQAHTWKGSNGLYDTLAGCLGAKGAPCYFAGRVVQAGSVATGPRTLTAAARVIRQDPDETVLYYTRAILSEGGPQGKLTQACMGRDGGFSPSPCGKTQIEVYVKEPD